MYLAQGVGMVLLLTIFSAVSSAVGVMTSPRYLMQLPHTMRRVQFGLLTCHRLRLCVAQTGCLRISGKIGYW